MADPDVSEPGQRLQRQVEELQEQVQALREQVADTKQRVQSDLRRTSTLPVGTFDVCDPMVEAALADSAVQIFLKHMTAIRPDVRGGQDIDDLPQRETVTQEEIDECLEASAEMGDVSPLDVPDVLAGLDDERLWILADLTRFGTGLTRQLATKELRQFLTNVWDDEVQVDTLKGLVQSLRTASGGASAMLHVLMLAASNSLARQGHPVQPRGPAP